MEEKYELTDNVISLLEAMHWDPILFYQLGFEDASKTSVHALIIRMKYFEETEKFHVVARITRDDKGVNDTTPYDFISDDSLSAEELGKMLESCIEKTSSLDNIKRFAAMVKDLENKFNKVIKANSPKSKIVSIKVEDGVPLIRELTGEQCDGMLYSSKGELIATFRDVNLSFRIETFNPPFTYLSDIPNIVASINVSNALCVNQDFTNLIKESKKIRGARLVFTCKANDKAWEPQSFILEDIEVGFSNKTGSPFFLFASSNIKTIAIGPTTKSKIECITDFPSFNDDDEKPQGRFANVVAKNSLIAFIQGEVERAGVLIKPAEVSSTTGRFGRIVS